MFSDFWCFIRYYFILPAAVRMTIDGGTKQWDKFLNSLSDDMRQSLKEPDLITGDFDSISNEVLEKYKKKGCKVIFLMSIFLLFMKLQIFNEWAFKKRTLYLFNQNKYTLKCILVIEVLLVTGNSVYLN